MDKKIKLDEVLIGKKMEPRKPFRHMEPFLTGEQ